MAVRPVAAELGRGRSDRAPARTPSRLALGILVVVVVCFAAFATSRMFPPQPYGLADDWRVFYAAASVVHHGGSPYDPALIHPAEQAADHYPSVQPSLDDYVNLPIVAWLLQPITALPFWVSYAVAALLGLAAAGVAMHAWLRRWGWRDPVRWTLVALLSWPALLGVFSGQFDLLLLAMLVAGLMWSFRRHPGAAGAVCMGAALIKPHVLWPLPVLLIASQLPERRAFLRCGLSAAATAVACVAGGELLMPGTTRAFLSHLLTFGGRISSVQPDLSGLPGLVAHLPAGPLLGAAVTGCGAIITLGFACFWALSRRARSLPPDLRMALGVGAGLAIWLAATPYAHPNDDVLLFPLLALVLGPGAAAISERHLSVALAGCLALIAAFVLTPVLGVVLVVAIAATVWQRRTATGHSGLAAASLNGLALLPMVWPFHVLPVSLTPLAVLVAAVAGVELVRRTLTSERDVPVLARRQDDLLA